LRVEVWQHLVGVGAKKQLGPCTFTRARFCGRKLAEINGDLLHGLEEAIGPAVFVPGAWHGEDGYGFSDGGVQESVVCGEVLKPKCQFATMDEDGKRVLREQSVDEVVELLVEDHLSDDVYGDGVEDNDVEDRWRVEQEVVAEGVRSGGCGGRDDCGVRAGVLLKGGECPLDFYRQGYGRPGGLDCGPGCRSCG